MSGARVFYPACRVLIADIDVTPFLGDGGYVSTTKDLYAPKGRWEVVVPDKPLRDASGSVLDSLYGKIAPMDRAEIRLARNAHEYPWGQPPVVMRGFVRSIMREESISDDGRPQRVVRISGDDYGAIGEIIKVSLIHLAGLGQSLLPVIRLDEMGIEGVIVSAHELGQVLLNAMNDQLQDMTVETGDIEQIKEISYDGQVKTGFVHASKLTTTYGTTWKVFFDQADTPWNELFIEDRDPTLGDDRSGPTLVYRPTPWKTLDGAFIANTGQTIDSAKVRSITEQADGGQPEFSLVRAANYQRSDDQVNNIYWVIAAGLEFNENKALSHALEKRDETVQFVDYEACDVDIYGPRVMTLTTVQFPSAEAMRDIHTSSPGELAANTASLSDWAKLRRRWLSDANLDNVNRDDGTLVVRGNEKLRIGSYYQITRGQFACDHYLTQVSHTFVPGREFFTHVSFIRSNNYYLRSKSQNSPFLLEGRAGVMER